MLRIVFILSLAIVLNACGGGNKEAAQTEEAPATETSEAESTESMEAAKDIVTVATETESLSTLVAAVKAGGLVETLQGEGPFTVFAPTNDAFNALPEGTLEGLLKPENKDQLAGILKYHVVSGKVMSTDLEDGMTASTVAGNEITVKLADGSAMINDATVVMADVETSNGVVHVIDKVLLPKE
jgi:uncharacterized surface protein with fasciclin (FAS1) repeats